MINLDKSQKYSIVGVPKCGTSSLGEYMRRLGYDVDEMELNFTNPKFAKSLTRIPIIITRDVIDRTWSDYLFFQRKTVKEACNWSRYEDGINLFKNPIIFKLEDMIKIPDFPHHNENIYKQPLTENIRKEIIMELIQ